MARTAYENLAVYQLPVKLAGVAWNMVSRWQQFDRDTLGKQLVRAADSIGANIAEGFGRRNGPDHRRFLKIARGSCYEAKHILRLAFVRRLIGTEELPSLRTIVEELAPRLNAYIQAVCRRRTTINNPQSTITE